MKRLGVFLLVAIWDHVSSSQGYPQHRIRRCPFILVSTTRVTVSCSRIQHSVPAQGSNCTHDPAASVLNKISIEVKLR